MLGVLAACLAFSQRMHHIPPPGVYTFRPIPEICVVVHTPMLASVCWSKHRRADVRYDPEEDVFRFDEPLAAHVRRAGVVVTGVDFDEGSNSLFVSFDGRARFTVHFRRLNERAS